MINISNNHNTTSINATSLAQRIILSVSAAGSVLMLGWMLWYSRYGFDFTDEGFYLVWMANPFNYSLSATQFGFIYHPLYEFLAGNIAAIRQANILITFGLTWTLGNVFLGTVFVTQSLDRTPRFIISGAVATGAAASHVFSGMWVATPNYNSLTLQSLLITATGLLLAGKYVDRKSIVGWLLIGIGGWLAFMAKPTTAVALGLCTGFYLLFAGRFSLRLLGISVAIAAGLIVLSAFAIDRSIIAFVDRLKGGAEMYHMLSTDHEAGQMFRVDSFYFGERGKLLLVTCMAAFFSASYFSQATIKVLVYGSNMLSIVFALTGLTIALGFAQQVFYIDKFQGLLIWSVPFAAALAGFSLYRFKGLFQISRTQWVLALTFMALPYAYAFGTGVNYWVSGELAGIFWVLAGLVLLAPIALKRNIISILLPLGMAVQMITVALIQSGIESPYRQPQPLRDNDYKIEVGRPGSTLILSKGFGQYLEEAVGVAKKAGFKQGTPMIDLTGQSPGMLYAMGASNIGQPWTVGGYPGSDSLAVAMLNKVTCQKIATAWILIEPDGPRKISPHILSSFGVNVATDFEIVGTFKTSEGAGGYKDARVQQLLKPVRSMVDATTACSAGRPSSQ